MKRRIRELDVNVLWFAILRTFEFEDWLGKKYAGTHVSTLNKSPMKSEPGNPFLTSDTDNTSSEVKKSSGNTKNPFSLLIARCFEKHMDIYVKAKSSKIHQQIEKYRSQVLKVVSLSRDPGAEINVLGQLADAEYLSNATELFVTFKSCLVDFCKISTSRPLLGLINNCFKIQLKQYSSIVLLEAIPGTRGTVFLKLEKRGKLHSEMFPTKKPDIPIASVSKKTLSEKFTQFKSLMSDKDNLSLTKVTEALSSTENITPLTKAEVCFTCKILGTVDWCYETTLQLETKLREKISLTEEVAEKEVSFEQELSLLNQITMSAIGSLVDDLYFTCCHKVMIQAIPKVNWEGIQAAGDTSPYVRECCALLKHSVPRIRDQLVNFKRFFTRAMIDFVGEAFCPNLLNSLLMCKYLPPAAAETLLMDVYAMKNFLMNLPNIDSSSTKQVPASFRKIVENGMVKSEHLLQAILSPHNDINRFVDSYKQLMIGEDHQLRCSQKLSN